MSSITLASRRVTPRSDERGINVIARHALQIAVSLLESAAPGRYRFHDLVRLFAQACAERDEPADEREAARSRQLDFYLTTAAAVYVMERPGSDPLVGRLESTGRCGLAFPDSRQAREWLFTEASNLLACVRGAVGGVQVTCAAHLLWLTKDLADSGGERRAYLSTAETVRDAAQSPRDAGRAHMALADAHLVAGRFEQADEEAGWAMRLAEEAKEHRLGDNVRGGISRYVLGMALTGAGRLDAAMECFDSSLEVFRSARQPVRVELTLFRMAEAQLAAGQAGQAVALAEHSLNVLQGTGGAWRRAEVLTVLGRALADLGRADRARACWQEALTIYEDLDSPEAAVLADLLRDPAGASVTVG